MARLLCLVILLAVCGGYLAGSFAERRRAAVELEGALAAAQAERDEVIGRYQAALLTKYHAEQAEHNTFDDDIGPGSVIKGRNVELALLRAAQEQVEILSVDVSALALERDQLRRRLGIER